MISATWKAAVGGSEVLGQLGQLTETLSQNKTNHKEMEV